MKLNSTALIEEKTVQELTSLLHRQAACCLSSDF